MLNNRYDFIMFFDVENGNPNGDPDAGNTPRIDAESGYGFVTDVCLKRKIRNYVELVKDTEPGYNILVKADKSLNTKFAEAYDAAELKKGQKGKNPDDVQAARSFMCKNYYDVRMFGAVMSTGDNPCGIVRGPVQINFARSISPDGQKEHCSVRALPRRGLCFRSPCQQGDRLVGGRSGAALDGNYQYV